MWINLLRLASHKNLLLAEGLLKVIREGGWGGVIGGYHVGCHPTKTSWEDKLGYKKIKLKIKIRTSAFI